MRILFNARRGVVAKSIQCILVSLLPLFLFACAASNVSRTTAANVDLGVQNVKDMADGVWNNDATESYQNMNQARKGAIIGGAAGAITGLAASPVGLLPGLATGAMLGASYGAYIDSNTNAEDRLENRGLNIVELGDNVLIVIPSARIFEAYSANIKPQSFSTLYLISKYINRYIKILVKVTVYTNRTGTPSADLALSNMQAQAVAKFLMASGIDARLLYAIGCGGTRLVASTDLNWDESDNYRIEITLEKLHA